MLVLVFPFIKIPCFDMLSVPTNDDDDDRRRGGKKLDLVSVKLNPVIIEARKKVTYWRRSRLRDP